MATVDPDTYTTPFAFTKNIHRDPYPFLSPDKPENSQKGKVIIITGAGSGIGAAAAKVWARAGAEGVVITGRRSERLDKVEKEIKEINPTTTVLKVQGDISVEKDVITLFAKVQETFGRGAEVLLNNAAISAEGKKIAEAGVDEWWKVMEVNTKGLLLMLHHYINSQSDPTAPVGTIISVLSGRVGILIPTGSAYNVSKVAEENMMRHLQLEYPTLRTFMTMPGIVKTELSDDTWAAFAKDHADLTGLQALYLAQPRADYLKGKMVGVNWDLQVMEENKDEIIEKKLLDTTWIPSLPFYGGSGLGH